MPDMLKEIIESQKKLFKQVAIHTAKADKDGNPVFMWGTYTKTPTEERTNDNVTFRDNGEITIQVDSLRNLEKICKKDFIITDIKIYDCFPKVALIIKYIK